MCYVLLGDLGQKELIFSRVEWRSCGNLMYSMVTIAIRLMQKQWKVMAKTTIAFAPT